MRNINLKVYYVRDKMVDGVKCRLYRSADESWLKDLNLEVKDFLPAEEIHRVGGPYYKYFNDRGGKFLFKREQWVSAQAGVVVKALTQDLQKTYNLNSVGMGMLYEKQQSATVQYATAADPNTWITIASYSNVIHRNIKYTDITPIDARYIKVTVSGTGQIGIGGLELYEASSTFEGNAATPISTIHGLIPYGYTYYGGTANAHGMSVRDVYGYASNRALTLYDGDGTYMAGIKKIVTASNKKTLEFRFRAVTIPASQLVTMRMMGTVSGSENVVFYFAVMPDGSIKANQGAGFTVPIAPAGTIPISSTSAWKLIKIAADESANTASVYVDGVLKGSCTMFATPANATNLTGFAFTSYGTATSGEIAYFDDINFYDPTVSGGSGIAAIATPSEILTSDLEDIPAKESFSISLSPNPASDLVKITSSNFSNGALAIYITDTFGKRVKTFSFNLDGETSAFDCTISGLLPGLYVVTATNKNQIAHARLIVR